MIKNSIIKVINTINTFSRYEIVFMLLLIYIVSIPIMQTLNLPLLGERLQFSEVIFLFLFCSWIHNLIKDKRLPNNTAINKQFFFFALFCLISFVHSYDLFISVIDLLGLLYLFVMLNLVVDIVENKRKLDIVVKFWIGTLVVVLLLGFIGLSISIVSGKGNFFCQFYDGNFPYLKTYYRMCSVFRHPLGLATYLMVSLGFVVSELLITEDRRYKIFLIIMLLFMWLAMINIASRDMIAFMLSSLLIYNQFHKKKDLKFRIIRFLSTFLIIIISLWFILFDFLFHIRSFKIENFNIENKKVLTISIDYNYGSRLAQKIAALEMLKRHPFTGVGLAGYRSYISRLNQENYFKKIIPIYKYDEPGASKLWDYDSPYINLLPPVDPHNDTLQYLAETGVLGGGAFIIFLTTFFYLIFSNLKRKIENERYFKIRLFCFFASFVGVLIESIGLDVFKTRQVWFMMAITLALIMIHRDKVSKVT